MSEHSGFLDMEGVQCSRVSQWRRCCLVTVTWEALWLRYSFSMYICSWYLRGLIQAAFRMARRTPETKERARAVALSDPGRNHLVLILEASLRSRGLSVVRLERRGNAVINRALQRKLKLHPSRYWSILYRSIPEVSVLSSFRLSLLRHKCPLYPHGRWETPLWFSCQADLDGHHALPCPFHTHPSPHVSPYLPFTTQGKKSPDY